MYGQHAPNHPFGWMPPCSWVVQAARSEPLQTALIRAKSMIGAATFQMIHSAINVRIVLNQLEKRFCLAQPIGPRSRTGGGAASSMSSRTKARSVSASSAGMT